MNSIRYSMVAFIAIAVFAFSPSVFAAKSRWNRALPTVRRGGAPGISFSHARLSAASRSVVVSFVNLDKVSKISYLLSYTGSGQAQGVGGSITPSGTTDSRDLYFGTCSHGVCTPHYNIKNAKLLVTATLTSGGTHTKRYLIRPKW